MDSSTPSSPTYRIFRDHHGIPQFEPKRGTQALKDALIYSFPTLETELQLMQAALRKFFDSERGSTFVFELPERDLQTSLAKKRDIPISPAQTGKASLRSWKVSRASRTPSRPSSRASSRAPSRASSRCETPTSFQDLATPIGGTMTTWVLSNGQELEKRKRQPYDPVKRRKVAENRGNACEKHRASKTACNPTECPQNKLFGRARRGSESSANESPPEIKLNSNITPIETPALEPCTANDFSQIDLDPPFDISDSSVMSGGMQDSYLGLDHSTVGSSSTSWTDAMDLGDLTWSSSQLHAPIPELMCETENGGATLEAVVENRPTVFEDLLTKEDFSIQNLEVVPEEGFHSAMDTMTLETPVPIYNASDDPFMGWASKRASHLFDDYGWVLSHVEAL